MQIRFNASLRTGEAYISHATECELEQLDPITRCDLLKDVVRDATIHYQAAMDALHADFLRANASG